MGLEWLRNLLDRIRNLFSSEPEPEEPQGYYNYNLYDEDAAPESLLVDQDLELPDISPDGRAVENIGILRFSGNMVDTVTHGIPLDSAYPKKRK